MKYKLFVNFKYNRDWNIAIEYENGQIISAHYCNEINSNINDIVLLKNKVESFNYLCCGFDSNLNGYSIEYVSNFRLSGNYCWCDDGCKEICKLDQNMDVVKEIG